MDPTPQSWAHIKANILLTLALPNFVMRLMFSNVCGLPFNSRPNNIFVHNILKKQKKKKKKKKSLIFMATFHGIKYWASMILL